MERQLESDSRLVILGNGPKLNDFDYNNPVYMENVNESSRLWQHHMKFKEVPEDPIEYTFGLQKADGEIDWEDGSKR